MELKSITNPLNTFMQHLKNNRMGSSFCRKVTLSLDRPKSIHFNVKIHRKYGDKYLPQQKERTYSRSDHKSEDPPQPYQNDFKIKIGPYGQSIKLRQHLPSPRRFRSRQSSQERSKFNTLFDKNTAFLHQFMNRRAELIKNNTLGTILSKLTGNLNVSALRIYKDKLKQYYNGRYSKQKLTAFFDYQFIQDYDSQLSLLSTLLALNLQQIHLICFLTLDLDSDGLLSNDDLFNLATATANQNFLLNKDIYTIFQYMKSYQQAKQSIQDSVQDEFTKDPSVTLQKYRLIMLKKQRQKRKSLFAEERREKSLRSGLKIQKVKQNKVMIKSRKLNKHLFSLYHEEEQGEAAIKSLRKRFAYQNAQNTSNFIFKLNFQRFKAIFHNRIPETYFDLLFTQGGVKVTGKAYAPLRLTVGEIEERKQIKTESDRYCEFKQKVDAMRQNLRTSRLQTLNKTHSRLLSL